MSLADLQWCPTSVQVTVLQARGLRAKGKGGTNDAYAVMQVGKEKYQTSVVEKSVAPVWREEAAFDLPPPLHQDAGGGGGGGGGERGTLRVHVLHRALVGPDKLLGQAVINLLQLSEDKSRSKTEWFKLLDKTGKADKDRGEVLLDVQFMRNNMTASMFDLSAAGKSRSRLGKFKDKVRGKKKESDAATGVGPSFPQVLTDSEGEANGDEEAAARKDDKKKKLKMKSLFSPKSNLQRNMSQSMSVLPAKNSTLSGSQSSGLNLDSSDGKKKFKFKIHKRSGSSDGKDSSSFLQKSGSGEQSNLCINGSHVYCEEPQSRTSRIGSNFSPASSGHGSMEDVPESSTPSVESLQAVRQYSAWTEEEEEEETAEAENVKKEDRKDEEEMTRMEEEKRRKEDEDERLAEQKRRQEEEERKRIEEEKVRREEEERLRRQEEEERVRREEEQEREKLAKEKRREEERKRVAEEEKWRREEEERIRMEKERVQEERMRKEEERIRRQEEEHRLAEEKRRIEEERVIEEERRKEEEEKKQRVEEERIRKEEERRQEEEYRAIKEKEEYERLAEERRKQEEMERERMKAEEKIKREQEESMRVEEERKRREEEVERLRREDEKRRVEEQEKRIIEEEQKRQREAEERIRKEEAARVRKEKEAHEKLVEETRKLEEQERRQKEEEERIKQEEEENIRIEEERRRQADEERARREEMARLAEEKRRLEEERQREEEERKRMTEEAAREKREEEARRLEMETDAKEQKTEDNKTKDGHKTAGKKVSEESPAGVMSTNLFAESSNNPFEDVPDSPADPPKGSKVKQGYPAVVSSVGSENRSTDQKVLIGAQRDKRLAPPPPRGSVSVSHREHDVSKATMNKQSNDKDVKTASVLPQRSVQVIAPISQPCADTRSSHGSMQPSAAKGAGGVAKHGKRPAPSRPVVKDELSPKLKSSETKHAPVVYGSNPFEDDEDEPTTQDDAPSPPGSVRWPPSASHDTASQAKLKSSKMARAPPPPAHTVPTSSTLAQDDSDGGLVTAGVAAPDRGAKQRRAPQPEVTPPAPVRDTSVKASQPARAQSTAEVMGVKKEGPPTTSRRLQPVKPLNPQEQKSAPIVQSEKNNSTEVQDKAKVNDSEPTGPYSQLTQEELISLVLKQEKQLSERDKTISELELYIDNLLVRVIEESPDILMSLSSLKKTV